MAIVRFTHRKSEVPPDARNVQVTDDLNSFGSTDHNGNPLYGPRPIWTWHTHVGLCLKEREYNGYDDSDFYMTVWNPATCAPEEIMFATTRGWSYPSYASYVDALPEVKKAYEAWQAAQKAAREAEYRKGAAAELRALRAGIRANIGTGERYVRALKLRRAIGSEKFGRLVTFLGRNLRSKFKLSLKAQALAWFGEAAPKYRTPLSGRQWEAVA